MANVMKYKAGVVGRMFNHYERRSGDNVQRRNEQIDPTRTYMNYDLHTGETADGQRASPKMYERMKKRLSEVKNLSKRSDVNLMCDWVITLPKDIKIDKAKEFFRHSYDFCCERYGKENVIGAWVHMDETTPHMHFSFVPVVTGKDGSERLCAKEKVSRFDLIHFHPDLQKYVEGKMQQGVAILNGATAGGNLTIIEMKMQKALEELAEVKATTGSLEAAQPFIENVQKMMNEVGVMYKELDTALKSKKWFGDDDKAKMKAVSEQLDTLKKAVTSASKTTELLQEKLQGITGVVDNRLDDVFTNLQELKAKAERRIKREENKVRRWAERVKEKEQAVDKEIEQGVQKKLAQYDKHINDKVVKSKALDKEIADKQKQLAALNTDFWTVQEQERQRAYRKTIEKWREDNERENDKSNNYGR